MGLVLSGFLTEAGWRWTMLLPAPVALIASLVLGLRLIPRSPREDTKGRGYDLPGAVTGTASMLLLVFTVVSALERLAGLRPAPSAPSRPSRCCSRSSCWSRTAPRPR